MAELGKFFYSIWRGLDEVPLNLRMSARKNCTYALQEFAGARVITVDDDSYYRKGNNVQWKRLDEHFHLREKI